MDGFLAYLWGLQKQLHDALGEQIRAIEGSAALLEALLFALSLGAVHALTPGHGKSIVFSYFLGVDGGLRQGVTMAAKVAGTHIASALVLVALFGSAVSVLGRPAGVAEDIQVASYALIVVIGLWLSYRAIAGRASADGHGASQGALPLAVGLLPCPMTMMIMTYASAKVGVANALVLVGFLGVGVAITIALVGLLAIALRSGAFRWLDPSGRGYGAALRAAEILSSLAVLTLGLVFLAGALAEP